MLILVLLLIISLLLELCAHEEHPHVEPSMVTAMFEREPPSPEPPLPDLSWIGNSMDVANQVVIRAHWQRAEQHRIAASHLMSSPAVLLTSI